MIKKYIRFFLFACLCFIIADKFVNADTVKFDNTVMTSRNYVVLGAGNRTFTFNTDSVFSNITDYPSYYLLTVCADNGNITAWFANNNTLSTINIFNTSYQCNFPNSTYTGGHIVYIYGSYNPSANCSSSLTNCVQNGSFTFYNPSSSSWTLLSYQNSKESISIDYASNSIISQNQSIINQQQQIINQNAQNTQDIINSQNDGLNSSTNSNNGLQSSIDSALQDCSPQLQFNLVKGKAFTTVGNLYDDANSYYTPEYYALGGATKLTTSNVGLQLPNTAGWIILYDQSKNYLTYYGIVDRTVTISVSGAYYYRLSTTMPSMKLYKGDGCKSKLDSVNDSITDDNVDGNSASDFFSDFTVTDNGGISSILTAPLVAINAMLSNQCTPLSGTWQGKTFELPCGTDFWNRMAVIRTWLNVAIGGLLCYRIIIKLFKLIEGFKNPDNDKVEVMNL